jgi:hypothetical protein
VKNPDCLGKSLYTQPNKQEADIQLHKRNLKTVEFVNSGEMITSDKLMFALSGDRAFLYYKSDFLYRSGFWREKKISPLYKNHENFRDKTVVLGHSDRTIRIRDSWTLTKLGAKNVVGFNFVPTAKTGAGIPLGITNDCDDSERHRILGNEAHFLRADQDSEHSECFTNSIYLNMTITNNSAERTGLYSALKNQKSVHIQTPELSDKGRINYLKNLRIHNLVPCPVGNGVDTHRIWETLYMGGTPVITKNRILEPLVKGLPVVILESWDNLRDFEFMEQKWMGIQEREWDMSFLNLTYQIGRLRQL